MEWGAMEVMFRIAEYEVCLVPQACTWRQSTTSPRDLDTHTLLQRPTPGKMNTQRTYDSSMYTQLESISSISSLGGGAFASTADHLHHVRPA
jgi:hypothetical protein